MDDAVAHTVHVVDVMHPICAPGPMAQVHIAPLARQLPACVSGALLVSVGMSVSELGATLGPLAHAADVKLVGVWVDTTVTVGVSVKTTVSVADGVLVCVVMSVSEVGALTGSVKVRRCGLLRDQNHNNSRCRARRSWLCKSATEFPIEM